MSQTQLKKATITVLDGADSGKIISVLFNPTEDSFERTNSYKATPVPGLDSPVLQFVNGECDQLSMELFLDDYTDPGGPTSLLQKENYLRRPTPERHFESAPHRQQVARAAPGAVQLGVDGFHRCYREAESQGDDVPSGWQAGPRNALGSLRNTAP